MLSDRVKKKLLLDSMYVAFYKKQDHRDRKQIRGCQRLGMEEWTIKGDKECSGDETVLYLD